PAWTARLHLSVMGFDNGMGNSEPEPEPTMTGLDATHSLLEGIENSWQHFRFNPDSVVAHAHQDFSGIVGRLDVNHAAVRRKFDCILNHVPKNLHQPRIIGFGKMLWRGQVCMDAQFFVRDLSFKNLQRAPHRGVDINGTEIEIDFSFGDDGEIENVVDQTCLE